MNGAGQIVVAGTLDQLAAFAADPPEGARVRPLEVAGAFHTEHMASAVSVLGGYARAMTTHDPRIPLISNADGRVVHDGRDVLKRLVSQVSNPVRWDSCMSAMADLGVTAVIEIPPAGTLTGLVKRALPGVETLAVKTPDDLPAAWKLINEHGRPANMENQPTWRLLVAPIKGTFRFGTDALPGDEVPSNARRRHRRDPARHDPRGRAARRHRRRVARRGRRPGRPGPAHRPPAPHRPGDALMSATITPSIGAPFARILSVAGYRPERVVTNDEICERIDSSDEWIRERSGIIERRFAAHDETVVDMASVAADRRRWPRRASPRTRSAW